MQKIKLIETKYKLLNRGKRCQLIQATDKI